MESMDWCRSQGSLLDFEDLVMCLGVYPHHCTINSAALEGPAHWILPPLSEDEKLILISRLDEESGQAEVEFPRSCASSRKKRIVSVVRNVGTRRCAESNQQLG